MTIEDEWIWDRWHRRRMSTHKIAVDLDMEEAEVDRRLSRLLDEKRKHDDLQG